MDREPADADRTSLGGSTSDIDASAADAHSAEDPKDASEAASDGGQHARLDANSQQQPRTDAPSSPGAAAGPDQSSEIDAAAASCIDSLCQLACEGDGTCSGTCTGDECSASCMPRSTCELACSGTHDCSAECGPNTRCDVNCEGTGKCRAKCGPNSECVIRCRGERECDQIECQPGAVCALVCSDSARCAFKNCHATERVCPDGTLVCGRDCDDQPS